MEKIKIKVIVAEQFDAWIFYLDIGERKKIKTNFLNAFPISTITISKDGRRLFEETFVNSLQNHITPTLLGVKNEDLLKIDTEFVEAITEKQISINGKSND